MGSNGNNFLKKEKLLLRDQNFTKISVEILKIANLFGIHKSEN